MIREKSVVKVKDGPSSTIMPTATTGNAANQEYQFMRKRETEQLINLVKGRSAKALKAFLDSEVKVINLLKVEDDKGYSLLHLAAFKKISNDFESIILEYANKQIDKDKSKLVDFINQ